MQYQLKSVKTLTKPQTQMVGGVEKYGIQVVITTIIVGQTYRGFSNIDSQFFELDPADTIDQSEIKMNAFATQYVATKYPNT